MDELPQCFLPRLCLEGFLPSVLKGPDSATRPGRFPSIRPAVPPALPRRVLTLFAQRGRTVERAPGGFFRIRPAVPPVAPP
eukprot:7446042-Pyramimonas_sp.AAC.1